MLFCIRLVCGKMEEIQDIACKRTLYLPSVGSGEDPHGSSALLHVPEEPQRRHLVGFRGHVHVNEERGEAANSSTERKDRRNGLGMGPTSNRCIFRQRNARRSSRGIPGPANLFKELLHTHFVPLLCMRSSPRSFPGNLEVRQGWDSLEGKNERNKNNKETISLYLFSHLVHRPPQVVKVQQNQRVPEGRE